MTEQHEPVSGEGPTVQPLGVRLVAGGALYPTIRVASRPGQLLMGVFQGDEYVEDTALNRRSGEQGAPVPRELFPPVTDSAEPEAIYAGPLYFHFGHFLLESLARAWYAQRHPELPLAWAGQHNWQGFALRPWQTEILGILGITNPTRIVADPTRYDVLHVPDLGYRYDDRFHPEHAAFLGRYEAPAQVPGRRLWLSRRKIATDARDLNSEPTERRLTEAGWTVAYPETLSIRQQLDHLGRAEVVAGEEGSAFHTLILLKDVTGKKFRILRRHGREHRNLHTIGDVRGVDQSFHSLERALVLKAEGRVVSKINPSSAEILDVFGVPVAEDRHPATPADALLDQTLAELEPERFLDVGAVGSQLVVGSSAPVRVAVSPRFGFDLRAHATSGVDFYELGLQQYAEHFHEGPEPFDVIRVTGADFQEVMASFRLSVRLAGEDTTWILGSGDLAARAALAVRTTQPGFTARRLLIGRSSVFLAQRVPGQPRNEAGVEELPLAEVQRRLRWLPPTSLRQVRRRRLEPPT